MLYQLHRFKLVLALSLTLAAVAAAPAAARFAVPGGDTQPVPPSTQPSPCSEVCSGGGYPSVARMSAAVAAINGRTLNPVVSHTQTTQGSSVRVVRHNDGFAWGDAGIGAGAAIALLAIVLGGVGVTVSRRAHRLSGSSATVTG